MKDNIIGKYYKRTDLEKNGVYIAYYILNFDGKYYETLSYELGLGVAIKVNDLKLLPEFQYKSNFKEITEGEFKLIEYLYDASGKFEYDNF